MDDFAKGSEKFHKYFFKGGDCRITAVKSLEEQIKTAAGFIHNERCLKENCSRRYDGGDFISSVLSFLRF